MTGQSGFVAPDVVSRERAHRRVVFVATALLVFLSTGPIFGHHLVDVGHAFADREHLLNLCLVALRDLLAPVHTVFHVFLGAGIAYGVFDRARAVRRLKETLALLRCTRPGAWTIVGRAAIAARVNPAAVRVVHGPAAPAFTAGLFMPLIYVSGKVARSLTHDELTAVIAHEDAHRRRRDPLRLSAWRFLACAFFFLPVVRRLAEDMADEAEVAADDQAVRDGGVNPLFLASALVSIASRHETRLPVAIPGFHRVEILDRRVRRLAGENAAVGTHLTMRSLTVASMALIAVWASAVITSQPGHAAGSSTVTELGPGHCEHERSALFHLFCNGQSSSSAPTNGTTRPDCPHES